MNKCKHLIVIAISIIARILLRVFYVFPIKNNRVLFVSFRGKQYSCNPRAVSEALQKAAGDKIEIGWAFHDADRFAFLKEMGITVLSDKTPAFIKFALTARVVCVNTYYKPFLPRRRGQFYLRTWHGGGAYKRVGKMEKMPPFRRFFVNMQQQGADLYLSSSEAFTRLTLRESFGYKGEVLERGMPRNDCLLKETPAEIIHKVYTALGVSEDTNIALYAPTFRPDDQATAFDMDFDAVSAALSRRFGGMWVVAFRGHHVVTGNARAKIDATDYMDMQELLMVSKALITDYSSSIWDMSLTFKPVFLYATDLSSYQAERDFYIDIHSWPFPLSENNDELVKRIEAFDEARYRADVKKHHEALGSYESGEASQAAARRILTECGVKEDS